MMERKSKHKYLKIEEEHKKMMDKEKKIVERKRRETIKRKDKLEIF